MKSFCLKVCWFFLIPILLVGCKDKETIKPDAINFVHEGSCVFWTYWQSDCPIDIYIDNEFVGTITESSYGPDCYESGCVTVKKATGTYNYYAANNGGHWSGTITIKSSCGSMRLDN